MLHISFLIINRLYKSEFASFVSFMLALLPKDLTYIRTYLSSLQVVVCRMTAIKSISVHNYSADYFLVLLDH